MRRQLTLLKLFILCILGNVSAADYFWVGGTGTWSDISHWATTSGGGITHVVTPSINDNVFFDANSFTAAGQTITINTANATCKNLDFTGVTFNPTVDGNGLRVSGSLTLVAGMSLTVSGNLILEAQSLNETVNFAGHSWPADIVFNSLSGGWDMNSDLNSLFSVQFIAGDLDLNGYDLSARQFLSSGNLNRVFSFSNSNLNFFGSGVLAWQMDGTNASLTSTNSTIELTGSGAIFSSMASGLSYNKILFSAVSGTATYETNLSTAADVEFSSSANVNGDNNFGILRFYPGAVYVMQSGKTQSITGNWIASGNCVQYTTIRESGATLIQLDLNGLNLNLSFMDVSGINRIGAGSLNISDGIDAGININVNFVPLSSRDLYWVGGTGDWQDSLNWSLSSGGVGGQCIPRPIDNVFFDANSFTAATQVVSVDPQISAKCHNMTWSGVNSPVFSYGGGGQVDVYGNLILGFTMTCSGSNINMLATDNGNIVRTNGIYIGSNLNFLGDGGQWQLTDDLNLSNYTFSLSQGSVDATNRKIYAQIMMSTGNLVRSLDLTNGEFHLLNTAVASVPGTWNMSATNMTFTSTGSHIYGHQEGSSFVSTGGGLTYNDVSFLAELGQVVFDAENSIFNNLSFAANAILAYGFTANRLFFSAGYTYELAAGINITLNTNLISQGTCLAPINIRCEPKSVASFTKNGSAINVDYNNIENVQALGSATFNATNSIPLGNVTGWFFTPRSGSNFYWIGNDGRWNDGQNWSFLSGGAPANCIPTAADNVYFDANSFNGPSQEVLLDTLHGYCRDMDWTGATGNPIFTGDEQLNIYGSLTLNPSMDWQPTVPTYFISFNVGNTIQMNGNEFPMDVWFEREAGTWALLDSFIVNAHIWYVSGGLNTGGNFVQAQRFMSTEADLRDLNIAGSDIALYAGNNAWQLNKTALTFNGNNSHIKFYVNGSDMRTYPASGQIIDYHDVTFFGVNNESSIRDGGCSYNHVTWHSDGLIVGDNSFDTLTFEVGHTYKLHSGKTQTILGTINANGSCLESINIRSSNAGSVATISKTNGSLTINRCTLQDITATGGATFNAAATTDLGNNTGWNIVGTAGQGLYWIGDAGDWSDPNHWAVTSGGAPSGCIPGPLDDVYFDQNSFSMPGQTVSLDIDGECHSMFWTGALFNPQFLGNGGFKLDIYGSLELNPVMQLNLLGSMNFVTTEPSHTIEAFGYATTFNGDIHFNGTGDWTLLDSLSSNYNIYLDKGTLQAANGTIIAEKFISVDNGDARVLNLGNSRWNMNATGVAWDVQHSGLNLIKGTSSIQMLAPGASFNSTGSLDYHNLTFHGLSLEANLNTNNTSFNKALFLGSAFINGSNTYDTLQFSPGYNYYLEEADTQYVNLEFFARGNNCFPIVIHSQDIPNPAFIFKSGGLVDSDFLELKAIHAIGGANFYAGVFSVDAGFNLNWNFSNSGNYAYGLGPDTTVFLCSNQDTFNIVTFNFNGGISWQWQDGYTGANYPATSSGLYVVTVYFANNCFTTDSVLLQVDTLTPAPLDSFRICLGDSVPVTANNGRLGFDYLWSNGDTTANTYLHPQGDSIFTVEVSYGPYSCVDTFLVRVNNPQISFTPSAVSCFGQADGTVSTTLSGVSFPVSYLWTSGQSSSGLTGVDAGWYYVQVTDALGCTVFDSVEVGSPTPIGINFTVPGILCNGLTTSLSYTGTGGAGGYSLFFPSGVDPNNLPAGTHNFSIRDQNGCSFDTVVTITEPDQLQATHNIVPPTCQYSTDGSLIGFITGGTTPYTFSWENGDTTLSRTNLSPGTYTLSAEDSNGCKITSSYIVESFSLIEADFYTDKIIGRRPLVVNFTNQSIDAQTYQWLLPDSTATSEDLIATFNELGDHDIYLVAYDSIYGCYDTSHVRITVESNPDINDPDVFTPNGDNVNDLYHFTTDDLATFHVQIFNRWGTLIYEWADERKGWDGKNFRGDLVSPGTYFYILKATDLNARPVLQNGFISVFY